MLMTRRNALAALLVLATALPLAWAHVPTVPNDADGTIVYYFHGDRRCKTCKGIEKVTHDVVHKSFAKALESGALRFETVNYESDANRHFVHDFGLTSSSVVVAHVKDGKVAGYELLGDVWRHARNHEKLAAYLESAIRAELGAAG